MRRLKGLEVLLVTAICAVATLLPLLGCGGGSGTPARSSQGAAGSAASACPSDPVDWSAAARCIGQTRKVCGPVIQVTAPAGTSGNPTFINVGKSYPDSGRFTIVIWGDHKSAFSPSPEQLYRDKRVCVSGKISLYSGLPQIEATSPSQITFQ